VPIEWVSSTTVAQFPNETHSSIRRTFTPNDEPNCKRVFCGFCGTHLSYWTEQPATEANYLSITLGSLFGDDLRELQKLDLLPEDTRPEDLGAQPTPSHGTTESAQDAITPQSSTLAQRNTRMGRLGDLDWFEEMVNGSHLGRTQHTRRGMGVSADGRTQVSWAQVSEYVDGDEIETPSTNTSGSKRKIEDIGDDDITMK
jgi:hypothetical protein